jgi:hypothetical protein
MFCPFTRNSNAEGSVGTIIEQGPFLPDRFAFKLFRELATAASVTSNAFYSPIAGTVERK